MIPTGASLSAGLTRLRELSLKGCDNLTWISVRCISGASECRVVLCMTSSDCASVLLALCLADHTPACARQDLLIGIYPMCESQSLERHWSVLQACGTWRSSAWSFAATSVPCGTSHVRVKFPAFVRFDDEPSLMDNTVTALTMLLSLK